MPVIETPGYHPPPLLSNGHLQTILPTLLRTVDGLAYRRERIATPDDDFLDIDWAGAGAERAVILSHGLEGSADRGYMRGMARALVRAGWDAVAWNYRGCSGEMNRQARFYHSGATEDLEVLVGHVLATGRYRQLALVGFSLGGNLTLKYLGERGGSVDPRIAAAVAFSVPCDLRNSSDRLARLENTIYMRRFLKTLKKKVELKIAAMPGAIPDNGLPDHGLRGMRTFHDFDNRFTAPLHGFADADDYWRRCSSRQFLRSITVPTLVVNALNDPFLGDRCYPVEEARDNSSLFLETPDSGGHVGFIEWNENGDYWMDRRAVEFLREHVPSLPSAAVASSSLPSSGLPAR
jgi:predicted alpha/beta-fold hydrolase